ncbi:MAG: hypothetical protein K9L30_01205 [Desulfobacterales bacterium]|nr:hypothetical protein [Desulfobacterales bacterium]
MNSAVQGFFNGGVKIVPDCEKISIRLDKVFHPDLSVMYDSHKKDHRILNIGYHEVPDKPQKEVIPVTGPET